MTRFSWLVVAVVGSGCSLYYKATDQCDSPQPDRFQRFDPYTLQCETFEDYSAVCRDCGFCPPGPGGDASPTWPTCDSVCNNLDEAACATNDACRVALDWAAYYSSSGDSFLGCFPLDTDVDHTNPAACKGRDLEGCSRDASCTALYQVVLSNCADCAPDFEFQECIPEGQLAGSCTGPVACDIAVDCPTGTTPGIGDVCYTGSCIPDQFCPPPPPTP